MTRTATADLTAVFQNRLVHKGLTAGHIPAVVGVQAPCMIGTAFIVFAVILYEERRIVRRRQGHTAAGTHIEIRFVVLSTLGIQDLFFS